MTKAELLAHIQGLPDDGQYCAHIWHRQDALDYVNEYGNMEFEYTVQITEAQADEAIMEMDRSLNSEHGLTWNDLEDAVRRVLERSKPT